MRRRWRIERSRIVDSDDIAVCLVLEPEPGYPGYTADIIRQCDANKRLIAAAPELLELVYLSIGFLPEDMRQKAWKLVEEINYGNTPPAPPIFPAAEASGEQ